MEKLRLDFAVKPTADRQSNVICITSTATPDGHIFGIPTEYEPAHLHQEITKTPNYTKVRKSLSKRHQIRKIWITLIEDILKIYLDEDRNLQFKNFYLEENSNNSKSIPGGSNQTLKTLLKKLLEDERTKSETQNLGIIAKDFMIEKFTGKNSNACQWFKDFNKECERFQIDDDKKKTEIFFNFLENSAVDWYNCMLIKLTVDSEWNRWGKLFCETFANKGWSPISYSL